MVRYNGAFRADFEEWHGREPQGKWGHWCPEWDFLPIDEFCSDIFACTCFSDPEFLEAKAKMEAEIDASFEEFEDVEGW